MRITFHRPLALLILILCATGCYNNLKSTSLSTAVLDKNYSDTFLVDENDWNVSWGDNQIALLVTDGSLPPGIELSGDGWLFGTPTAVGDFDFEVTAYTIHDSYFDDSEDDVYGDSETFTLFVTETSTNLFCPDPSNTVVTETYLCLGDLTADYLEQDDAFFLDVNYFVDFNKGGDYDIRSIDFTIFYDPDNFAPVTEYLNSQILREAATRTGATVEFTEENPGELHVVLTAQSKNLHKSGRIMDLPFYAVQNVPAGTYSFPITINSIVSGSGENLPSEFEVDGQIVVAGDVPDSTDI